MFLLDFGLKSEIWLGRFLTFLHQWLGSPLLLLASCPLSMSVADFLDSAGTFLHLFPRGEKREWGNLLLETWAIDTFMQQRPWK